MRNLRSKFSNRTTLLIFLGIFATVGIAITLLCAVPFLLMGRNLNQVRQTNGPSLRQFARTLYTNLPPGKSVVLSDDPVKFILLRAELSAHRHDKDPLILDALSLTSPHYHALLARQFKSRWQISFRWRMNSRSVSCTQICRHSFSVKPVFIHSARFFPFTNG